jgi:hypothetical protein
MRPRLGLQPVVETPRLETGWAILPSADFRKQSRAEMSEPVPDRPTRVIDRE